jgi:hypothetical protein
MQSNRRFVAHIDILGMRAMMSRDAETAWKVLSGLANVRDHLSQLQLSFIETARQERLGERVMVVMFSDTIVLFTKSESNEDLQSILIALGEFMHKAMLNFVPVRAGLVGGQFFFNIKESMYAGPALIEAYEIGEAAQWLGIVTTREIYEQSIQAGFKSGIADIVVAANIPIKSGSVAGFAVDWVSPVRNDFKVKPPISVKLFYSQFESAFGPLNSLRNKERRKYRNTTKFMNDVLSKT